MSYQCILLCYNLPSLWSLFQRDWWEMCVVQVPIQVITDWVDGWSFVKMVLPN